MVFAARFRSRQVLRVWVSVLSPLAALGCGPAADAQHASAPITAEEAKLGKNWIKLQMDGDATLAMDTAIVRFVPDEDYAAGKAPGDYERYVDLVAAVHIADRAYYEKLNRRFRDYDAVLYELVAPEGTVVPKGRGTSNGNPVGALQNAMSSFLEVHHQLEEVDYTRPNFVHADISPEEFSQSMERRDESFLQMYLRVVGAALKQQAENADEPQTTDLDVLAALMAKDRARRLKILLAKQFQGMESLMLAFSGEEGSTLITERNNRALDVLEEQLDDGQKRLAIFYGAGHLAEMKDQLMKRFDMRPVSEEWLEAWDLRPKDEKSE